MNQSELDQEFKKHYPVELTVGRDPEGAFLKSMISYQALTNSKIPVKDAIKYLVSNMVRAFQKEFSGPGSYAITFESPDGIIFNHLMDYAGYELCLRKKQ